MELDTTPARSPRSTQVALCALVLGLIGLLAAAGLLVARQAAVAADSRIPLAERTAAARMVRRLRPYSASAEARYAILGAQQLFEAGHLEAARHLLYRTYLRNPANESLRNALEDVDFAIRSRESSRAPEQPPE